MAETELRKRHNTRDKAGKTTLINTDLTATRKEWYVEPPAFFTNFFLKRMKNAKDLPLLFCWSNISAYIFLGCAMMLSFEHVPVWLGVGYLVGLYLGFFGRFVLCLHYSEHLPIFHKDYNWMNFYGPLIVCPFMGLPSGGYYIHHVVMHHCENNIFPHDLSSTEPYQRDNPLHFVFYWLRFLFAIYWELAFYCVKQRRWQLLAVVVSAYSVYATVVYHTYMYHATFALYAFMIPNVITSFFLMFGNWSQHIFLDPAKPRNNYGLTYNCINSLNNQMSFNDGYHIGHHVNSRLHWTQLPEEFMKNLDKYAGEDSIVFEAQSGPLEVGLLVFLGKYQKLWEMMVHVHDSPCPTPEEFEAKLRSRLKPIFV